MTINDLCFSFYRGFHNSLIVNELFFFKIWPVQKFFVSLLCKVQFNFIVG